ncbi:MAG TPA: M14 family metallopeptidase [Armatimonadota bacterium]|jgi:hypothetical protein
MDATLSTEWLKAAKEYTALMAYAPGERLSTPEQVGAAVQGIAKKHPKTCSLETYGHSVEGRPLQLLTIASAVNKPRLGEIRKANQSMVAKASNPPVDLPATVWIIANVHGDEHSTAEAAVALAACLADGSDPLLSNAVVCIDPCQNPDGRARSVNSYYSLFGLKPRRDADAAEHWDPWEGGRGNHYFFDMNRDWFPLTQPESQARVNAFLSWRPQVVADLHEMWWDSRFFFPPPARPMNPNLGEHILRWWEHMGRRIGKTFDANGWDYWTGEIFDAFFPGYGEAFPSIHGSIGMTFEQASAAGIEVERKDGTLLTFEEAIRHHFVASLTVCRVAAERRADLLKDTVEYFAGAAKSIPDAGIAAYVFPDSGFGTPAEHLASLLSAQGIVVERLRKRTVVAARPYDGGEEEMTEFDAGSIIVRLDQPEGRAARALLERETEIDSAFVAEQMRRLAERMPAEIYDHTAWSLPLALGVRAFSLKDANLTGEPWKPRPLKPVSQPEYGFLIRSDSMAALTVLCGLLNEGVRVHVARRDFAVGGQDYRSGTFIIKQSDQPLPWEDVCGKVAAAATEYGAALVGVDSAWTDEGINLGSDHVALVKLPRVAVLYAEPTSTLSYGWMAHLFEQRLDLPFTPVRAHRLKDADLRKYDVIVLPDGRKEGYAAHLDDDLWKNLHDWVRQGGTLIAIGGAAACIAGKGKDWTTSRAVTDLRDAGPEAKAEKEEIVPPEFRPERVPGAALRVTLDRHQWATLGFGDESHVLCSTDLILTPSVEGRNAAVFVQESRLVLSGLVWDKMRPAIAGKAYLVDETQGKGHVLLFAGDPNQRGYWDVTSRLFANAVLLGPR